MKKLLLPIIAMCTILFTSCDSDSTAGISKVTYYPNMTLNGEEVVVLTEGDTYTDQGAISEANDEALAVEVDGSVDTSKPDVYKITYSSLNSDGFAASLTRTVIVLSNKPTTIDLSGAFKRGSNINNVTKISDRKYSCDNATGYTVGNDNNISLTFYNIDDKQVYAPFKANASATGISAESSDGVITDANNWKWKILASSFFGTADRIFTR